MEDRQAVARLCGAGLSGRTTAKRRASATCTSALTRGDEGRYSPRLDIVKTEPSDDHPRVADDVTGRIAWIPRDEPGALQAAIDADGAIPQRTPDEVRGRRHRLAIERVEATPAVHVRDVTVDAPDERTGQLLHEDLQHLEGVNVRSVSDRAFL